MHTLRMETRRKHESKQPFKALAVILQVKLNFVNHFTECSSTSFLFGRDAEKAIRETEETKKT